MTADQAAVWIDEFELEQTRAGAATALVAYDPGAGLTEDQRVLLEAA